MKLTDRQYLATPFYGARKIAAWMKSQNYQVNRKRVRRLMQLIGWEIDGLDWIEIEIKSDKIDRPSLNLIGKARERATELGVERTWVSLSHEEDIAVALVILEG